MKESNLSFKNIFKREMKLASYIIVCVTIMVISLSYAMFFQVDNNSKNQEVVAGDLTFTYQNGEEITSAKNVCFMPMTYDESTLYVSDCSYKFSVRNTGSLKANYTIKLIENEENEVELEKLKVVLKKQKGDTLEEVYTKTISEIENGLLATEEMDAHSSVVYSVQIYVDEENYRDGDEEKKVSFQIEGTGLVHEEQEVSSEKLATTVISQLKDKDLVDDETVDHNLRYIGTDPANYIDIGDNTLWRIIGVMNNIDDGNGKKETRLKVIRSESIGEYSWDTSNANVNIGAGVNEWSNSKLMKLLNSETTGEGLYWNQASGKCYAGNNNTLVDCNFSLNGLSDKVKTIISPAIWHMGSNGNEEHASIITAKFYEIERSNNPSKICASGSMCNDTVERTTTWIGKVGLISPSDYGYATSGGNNTSREICLSTVLHDWSNTNDCYQNSWLYQPEVFKWSMNSAAVDDNAVDIFMLTSTGDIHNYRADSVASVYPVIYLNADIKISDGVGSKNNPFMVSIKE